MRKHRRKIYYSPGLISILLLPIFCIFYLKSINAFTNYGSLDLYVWDGKMFKKETDKFIKSKNFETVNLTGNNKSDSEKLKYAQSQIHEIIKYADSINGIKFHFEKKAEYWSFVKAIEILNIEKAKVFIPYKNDIWFANPKTPKKAIKNFVCGTKYNCIYEQTQQQKSMYNVFIENIKIYYLSMIAYLLMVIFTFTNIFKKKLN